MIDRFVSSRFSGDTGIAWLLLIGALALRALLPVLASGHQFEGLFTSPPGDAPYRAALRDHFLAFLWYEHTLPLLFTAKNGLLYALLPADWFRFGSYALTVFCDAIGTALAFLMLRRFGIGKPWAALTAAAISLRFVPWETWHWGTSWDALSPFFVLLFCWSIVRFVAKPEAARSWNAGLCGALLIGGFQFGLPIFIAAAVGALILMTPRRGLAAPALRLFVIPVCLTAGIVAKNVAEHDLWSLSSGAGENIIENLNMALQDREGHGALRFGIKNGYPQWWAWCYEEAERHKVIPVPNVSGLYGMCTFRGSRDWDFSGLREYLARHPDPELAKDVTKDIDVLRHRPWLWTGPVWERITDTSIAYGKISQRLLFDVAREHPWNFVARIYYNLREFFLIEGYRFLIWKSNGAITGPPPVRIANAAAAWLFLAGFAAAAVYFAASALRRIVLWLRPAPAHAAAGRLWTLGAVSAGVIAVALLSAMMSCCENHRHAFCVLPVMMCLGAAGLADAARTIVRITKSARFR